MTKQEIGRIITERRNKLGLKLFDLAKLSGVSSTVIKSIESGNSAYTLDTLEKLTKVFGLEIKIEEK